MVTFTGTQSKFENALQELVELDYDATEAYSAAIERVGNAEYKAKLQEFLEDHQRHIKNLSALLLQHNQDVPTGPSTVKQWLAKGKIYLANLNLKSGNEADAVILAAMYSNEEDTNTAYSRMAERKDQWEDAKPLLEEGLRDERKHQEWLKKFAS